MKNHIVFYFCGTAREHERSVFHAKSKKSDQAEGILRRELHRISNLSQDNRQKLGPILSYDGCNLRSSSSTLNKLYGSRAHGTGERAKEALKTIRAILKRNNGQTLKINVSGHSRGCISALKLMKYIHRHQLEPCDGSHILTWSTEFGHPS
ncbi:hypothetical protein [uncultured Shewanella sp.]|uniref:hypothetical protein n=1 Tax=uncultured Shewanella sp. TaxID=173975 RepID=UPI00261801C9|nr:hypothetical protein [uncultured Shewanella sp.]